MVLPVRSGRQIDTFLGEIVAGLGENFAAHGLDLFIATVTGARNEVEVIKHIVDGARADAIVLPRSEIDDPRARFLLDRQFPFVVHGRLLTETRPYVYYDTDGEAAFAKAAEMLIGLGHRRFGLITVNEPFTFATLRRRGLEKALAAAGLSLAAEAVESVPMSDREAALAAADRLLAREPRPTAIFGITDLQGLAVLERAARRDIAVPDALSVIGFDDVPVAAYADPPLSTFAQNMHESARTVAGMVIDVLAKGPRNVGSRLVKAKFVPRGSHAAAPKT
jgi:LacI family transcriptional regulator